MPSPSKLSLVISLIATGGFLYGGAWLASGMTPTNTVPPSDPPRREIPKLAPVPSLSLVNSPASTEEVSHTFESLTAGPYAITIVHDENGNYDLGVQDGYPVEGYGVSGAKNAYDEPSFRKASVKFDNVSIQMHYLQ